MKYITFTLFYSLIFCLQNLHSQIPSPGRNQRINDDFNNANVRDSLRNSKGEIQVELSQKTVYTDYKIISHQRDTSYIDTTLTILKEYKYNFLRKDNFELLPFHNQGQTFNRLSYSFQNSSSFPSIGMDAKQFNYIEIEDIDYYQVPTPTTEILYRTGMEQGQVLETLFTLNFSKRFNVGVVYKGLRSLGKYRRTLASHGNFRTVFSYQTKNNRYQIRGHIALQDLLNQESGGLTDQSLENFITDDPNFSSNRGRLDVNLEDTETLFEGERFYFTHDYKLFSSNDTILKRLTNLKIGHTFTRKHKFYQFTQNTLSTDIFGDVYANNAIDDKVENRILDNELFLEFNSPYILGKFKVATSYANYSYGYDDIINKDITTIDRLRLEGNAASLGGTWNAKINKFQLNTAAKITPGTGRLSGSHLYGEAVLEKDSLFSIKASMTINSKSPNFNTLLFQSRYNNYNWDNPNFKNINTRNISFSLNSKWLNASGEISNIENYTYFNQEATPQQYGKNINYFKIKVNNEFKVGKFALNNTFLYQRVGDGDEVLRVPDFITRNTLYYTDYWFKGKPMLVQIGTTFKYFSKYKANAFNPLLNEFTLQNDTEIGFPTLDVFFNAQVRRTRIYFKIDNVASSLMEKNYFSAPNYPYRDFVIRFGVVWNWFI